MRHIKRTEWGLAVAMARPIPAPDRKEEDEEDEEDVIL